MLSSRYHLVDYHLDTIYSVDSTRAGNQTLAPPMLRNGSFDCEFSKFNLQVRQFEFSLDNLASVNDSLQ